MRAVIQRVKSAEVAVEGEITGRIGEGILTLLGIGQGDTAQQVDKVIQKIAKLRIFADERGKMNLSLQDVKGGHLIVSQFTLYGDTSKGNRPGFGAAAAPAVAESLYERAIAISRSLGIETASGRFGADMKLSLLNDGPVTFIVEA